MTKPFLLISAQFAPALLSILDPRPSTLDQALLFIELTDHLRCPNDHDESFLVLLPDLMEGRSVRTGQLGCPICSRTFQLRDGVLDTGDAPLDKGSTTALGADALTTLVGLHGPGGYLTLVGAAGGVSQEVAALNPGVSLVAVNPPPDVADSQTLSVLRAGRLPLKSGSMRGVVLSRPYGDHPDWVREAARAVLPGLRVVGEGKDPPVDVVELLASAEGVWVGTTRR
jgi:uncharacterized protein YbaR (Trm112 family)